MNFQNFPKKWGGGGGGAEFLNKKGGVSKIGIHSMQGSTATTRHGITRKRSTTRLMDAGNPFRKNL